MAYEPNDGWGSLFKNDKKGQAENAPIYRGNCKVGGVVYEMAAWIKETKNGQKYFNIKFQDGQDQRPKADGDDIPF